MYAGMPILSISRIDLLIWFWLEYDLGACLPEWEGNQLNICIAHKILYHIFISNNEK